MNARSMSASEERMSLSLVLPQNSEKMQAWCDQLVAHQVYAPYVPAHQPGLLQAYQRTLRGEGAIQALWVMTRGEQPVGVGLIDDTQHFHLFVLPDHRGQGWGRKLVQAAVDSGRHFDVIHTSTSRHLYHSFQLPDPEMTWKCLIRRPADQDEGETPEETEHNHVQRLVFYLDVWPTTVELLALSPSMQTQVKTWAEERGHTLASPHPEAATGRRRRRPT